MEIVIVICLLIVIALQIYDRISIKRQSEKKPMQEIVNPDLPEIMGQPKALQREARGSVIDNEPAPAFDPDELDIEYDANEELAVQVPEEELDALFSDSPDWEEEEEEWQAIKHDAGQPALAQGVSFDELHEIGEILQQKTPEPVSRQKAADIARRIQGTELYSLLEESVEGASLEIARLLDNTLSNEYSLGSNHHNENEEDNFDISAYV